jgi:hypothetical protein
MNISKLFKSNYLKGQDLDEEFTTMTIERLEVKEFDNGDKPVLYFEGEERGLVLNRTNANAIIKDYGADTDQWIGRRLVLFTMPVEFNGTTTNAIRVKTAPKAPRPSAQEQPDDRIPF